MKSYVSIVLSVIFTLSITAKVFSIYPLNSQVEHYDIGCNVDLVSSLSKNNDYYYGVDQKNIYASNFILIPSEEIYSDHLSIQSENDTTTQKSDEVTVETTYFVDYTRFDKEVFANKQVDKIETVIDSFKVEYSRFAEEEGQSDKYNLIVDFRGVKYDISIPAKDYDSISPSGKMWLKRKEGKYDYSHYNRYVSLLNKYNTDSIQLPLHRSDEETDWRCYPKHPYAQLLKKFQFAAQHEVEREKAKADREGMYEQYISLYSEEMVDAASRGAVLVDMPEELAALAMINYWNLLSQSIGKPMKVFLAESKLIEGSRIKVIVKDDKVIKVESYKGVD